MVEKLGGGQSGVVFAVRCRRPGLPDPRKTYAVKLVFAFDDAGSSAHDRCRLENEFEVLCQLPPHRNLNRFWAQFSDEVGGG